MCRFLITLLIIIVGAIGILAWLGSSKKLDETLVNLNAEKQKTMVERSNAILKVTTMELVLKADDFYQKNPKGVFEIDAKCIGVSGIISVLSEKLE